MSTIVELLGRNNSCSSLENRDYGRVLCADHATPRLYPQKLALTSPTSSGRSIGIVHSQTKGTEHFNTYLFLDTYISVKCGLLNPEGRIFQEIYHSISKFQFPYKLYVLRRMFTALNYILRLTDKPYTQTALIITAY
jgi:hypothetical protein